MYIVSIFYNFNCVIVFCLENVPAFIILLFKINVSYDINSVLLYSIILITVCRGFNV